MYLDWNLFFIGRKSEDCWKALNEWINEFKMNVVYQVEPSRLETTFKSKLDFKTKGEIYLETTTNGVNAYVRFEYNYRNETKSLFKPSGDGKIMIDLNDLNLSNDTRQELKDRQSVDNFIQSLQIRLNRCQIYCTICKAKLDRTWKKCPTCDTAIGKQICPGCGIEVDERWMSCPKCSTTLRKTAIVKGTRILECPRCGASLSQPTQATNSVKCAFCNSDISFITE